MIADQSTLHGRSSRPSHLKASIPSPRSCIFSSRDVDHVYCCNKTYCESLLSLHLPHPDRPFDICKALDVEYLSLLHDFNFTSLTLLPH